MLRTSRITSDPLDILRHYALGDLVGYQKNEDTPTVWQREAHRGVHLLGEVRVPKSQRRYVFHPKFELRFDTAFEAVLRACAERPTGRSWVTPPLVDGYLALHRMGFAHSFEAWCDGQLAGGCFGVQIGSYISVDSMFYTVSNASKAAYGQALVRLKERGFTLVDSNPVSDEARNYGEEWVPQWRYEELLAAAIDGHATLADHVPCPPLPDKVRRGLPLARFVRKVAVKVQRYVGLDKM
ncbi:MAG TPA: leucyl/phenylalanyl-tRNA--protein transferase [Tepidisphaeraceae bacterium]|nr:leucyl/phenylalanyl-tRNA--protein transferase [Tepidisphaeraceae bacterium]